MDEILTELRDEVLSELRLTHAESLDAIGSPEHQLKLKLDAFIEEAKQSQEADPFDLTNRVLSEFSRFRRFKC